MNGTMFFKRTGDLNFAITDALKPEVGDPAKQEMLVCECYDMMFQGSGNSDCVRSLLRLSYRLRLP